MPKRTNPSFTFYPDDWRQDTSALSLEARGLYFELLCWLKPRRTRERNTYDLAAWARMVGAVERPLKPLLSELVIHKLCIVAFFFRGEEEWATITLIRSHSSHYPMPGNWQALRRAILTRDNHQCQYCGKPATSVDHKIPRAQGGSHAASNLVAACRTCNAQKKDSTPEQWRQRSPRSVSYATH